MENKKCLKPPTSDESMWIRIFPYQVAGPVYIEIFGFQTDQHLWTKPYWLWVEIRRNFGTTVDQHAAGIQEFWPNNLNWVSPTILTTILTTIFTTILAQPLEDCLASSRLLGERVAISKDYLWYSWVTLIRIGTENSS